MNVLVCVKRVPAFGAKVPITDDGTEVDTQYLGFTIGPHEECAVEEAVRLVTDHGGHATVLTVGPAEAEEQLRYALAMGANQGVLVETETTELDPQATADAIVEALRWLRADGAEPFDLLLFGVTSADAGHGQVGVRVATELELPMVGSVKGIDVDDSAGELTLRREVVNGVESCRVAMPAVVGVKEGLNLPRYPSMPGRLRAKKATVRRFAAQSPPGGLETLRLRQPAETGAQTVLLGRGADAAPAVVDVFERLGVM